jgi:outer membrane receptor protein involved in Fe transport
MPWNPALWFMLSRLRLAVELDCDARVLRGGVAPNTYGNLLIDLAERAAPLRLATTALADDSSHLAQRILAMKPTMHRFAYIRASAVGALGIASLVAACSTALPTDADIKKMDATSAEGAARQLRLVAPDDSVHFVVDGQETSGEVAKKIVADRIQSVEVSKMNGKGTIAIRTKSGVDSVRVNYRPDSPMETSSGLGRIVRDDSIPVSGPGLKVRAQRAGVTAPIFFIDGVRVDEATFSKLDRSRIAQVDVIKGAAAAAAYGPDAAAGAIIIKTLPR